MNLEDLGNVGEFVGAIGVVVSLLYLALQIRRSAAVARAENERELLTRGQHHILLTQPELIDVLRRGFDDFDALSKDDRARFHHYFCLELDRAAAAFRMHRDGLMSDEIWEGFQDVWLSILSTPGGRQWWEAAGWTIGGRGLHEEFRRAIAAQGERIAPLNEIWSFYSPDD